MPSGEQEWRWVDEDPIEVILRRLRQETQAEQGGAEGDRAGAPGADERPPFVPEDSFVYQNVVVHYPKHPTVHYNWAVFKFRSGRWREAAEAFRRARENNPERAESAIGLGACLLHMEQFKEALSVFREVLYFDPDNRSALFGKAVTLQILGRDDEAQELYRLMLASNPQDPETLSNLVALDMARGNVAQARSHAELLLTAQPKSLVALRALAWDAFDSGDYKEAAIWCGRLVKADPHCNEAWFNLRFALERLVRPSEEDPLQEVWEVIQAIP